MAEADKEREQITRRLGAGTGTRRTHSTLLVAALLALRCIAALFILLAVYSLVRGFWRLFIFFGGLLFYGPVTVESESFPRQLGEATYHLIGPLMFGAVGGLCLVIARRLRARLDLAEQADDERAPVVYLRSFGVDRRLSRRPLAIGRVLASRTEEEQLVQALRESGPVVALGRPGERLPRLGAQRVYVEDADWRQQILSWFARAALVVIHIPATPTEGLVWEVEHSLKIVPLDRLVFLPSRDVSSLDWLNQQLRNRALTALHPKKSRRAPYGSRISGIVHFVNGQPEFRALVKPPFLRRPFASPLVPVYRLALQPVTTRIAGSWRPLVHGFGDLAITALWTAFWVAVVAFAVSQRRSNPFERETFICGNRLLRQLPAEARELAANRDQQGARAWMQSHVQRGIRYVPDGVVVAQATVKGRLLAAASPADCAALADGTIRTEALHALFNEVGKQDRDALGTWCACVEAALLESLKSTHTKAFPVSEAEAAAAFGVLREGLSENDSARFDRIVDDYEKSSTEDHCWFARVIFQGIERLREPSRSTLARVGVGQDIEE
jgi:hypothetical protein